MPVAVSCWVAPIGMPELADVTRMEYRVAEVTVREAPPEVLPEVAAMVVVPAATAVARPLLLTVATDGFEELQVTCAVTSKLVPSEYVPVAVNCWMTPIGMLELAEITRMEDRVAEDTVREVPPERLPKVVLPMIMPEVAVRVTAMVVVPAATAVARPLLLTVATDGFEELQVTCAVTSWLVPSEYAPVAVNCWVAPTVITRLTGVTDIETRAAGVPPPFPHVVRDIAKKARKNTAETNLKFFRKLPSRKKAARLSTFPFLCSIHTPQFILYFIIRI